MSTFQPFMHCGGDLWQRVGGHWRHISRDMAMGHVIDLLVDAISDGDLANSERLTRDANCLLTAIGEHDQWHRCGDRPAPVREKEGQRA